MRKNDPEAAAFAISSEGKLYTSSQRKLNLIWEVTQAGIALTVVGATILSTFMPPTSGESIIEYAFFLVIGFYFGRTNHARMGGVEPRSLVALIIMVIGLLVYALK